MLLFCLFLLFSNVICPLEPGERTTKDKPLAMCENYEMRKDRLIAEGATQVWRCVRKTCPGRARSPAGTTELVQTTAHNHLPNIAKNIARVRMEEAKETARNQPNEPPRNIIGTSRHNLDDEARINLPSYTTAQRIIEKQRINPAARDVDKPNIQQIAIHGEFATDVNGRRFLLHDSRVQEPERPVFFMFATDEGLNRLKRYRNWAGDGTFKDKPLAFMQLYTINILIDHASSPCVYILMANKQRVTYRRMFRVIRYRIVPDVPLSLLIDFEERVKEGFQDIFGNQIPVKNCLFHLGQSVMRNVQSKGATQQYGQDKPFRIAIRSLVALALLRTEEVEMAFDILDNRKPAGSEAIYQYFRNTYVYRLNNNNERRPPMFWPRQWNMHDNAVANLQRTNNAMEGWHNTFADRFSGIHPPLSKFISEIKKEEDHQVTRLQPYEIDHTRGISERNRNKNYVRNDELICQLIQEFEANEEITEEKIINHLTALQYRLAEKGLEEWNHPSNEQTGDLKSSTDSKLCNPYHPVYFNNLCGRQFCPKECAKECVCGKRTSR